MAKSRGILLNSETLDLQLDVERNALGQITQGIVCGNTLYQNQALILQSVKGEYKEYPILGVGISAMVCDDDLAGWKREIALQLEADTMRVDKVEITTQKLVVNADYSTK